MSLFRLYAYAVPAQKNVEPPMPIRGGALGHSGALADVVNSTTTGVRQGQWAKVVFNVNSTSGNRDSPVRTAFLSLAFEGRARADAAAASLAERLSGVMDQRAGDGCLMVIAVNKEDQVRKVTVWTFPSDEALQFSTGASGPNVSVLRDAFSRRSHLRKACRLEGIDQSPTTFLTAEAVDLVTGGPGQLAEYWISDFLDAELSVSEGEGSRALARALRAGWDATSDKSQRKQFLDAAIGVRASTRAHWSIRSFADEYLSGTAKATFLKTSDARRLRNERFRLSHAEFDKIIKLRVLDLDNGLRISAPFLEANDLLTFDATPSGTRVTATGVIRIDKVSQRA